jgi:hypothetical protein
MTGRRTTTKDSTMTTNLAAEWLEAKEAELAAIEKRRKIEDAMLAKGQTEWAGYTVRIAERDNWKVDGDKLQALAEANNLTLHLATLFRWKPEVNKKIWDAAAPNITKPLLPAITITPGRPTFTIREDF